MGYIKLTIATKNDEHNVIGEYSCVTICTNSHGQKKHGYSLEFLLEARDFHQLRINRMYMYDMPMCQS